MGAGKQEPPPPPPNAGQEPPPVVLGMVLHCAGCAKKVRKSIHRMPGVVSVVADPATNTVVVAGTADAAALKARIEDKTKKPVQILSAGAKQQGGENSDKGDKAGAAQPQPQPHPQRKLEEEEEEEESKLKKQPPVEEKKQFQETTALLRIRLHCDSCADRIRRRIYKIKGVKDVVMEGSAKDEVKVVGTMDVPAMVAYLNDKLNRAVELATPAHANKHGGDDGKKMKDKAGVSGDGDGHAKKDKAAHRAEDRGKGIEVVGPSVASAAASLAPAPAGASTHHVSPYGYGHVAYPQPPQQPGYYSNGYGNADGGAGYANAGGYYQQQPSATAGGYYQQQPRGDAGGYFQQQERGDGGGYYQHQPRGDAGGYYQQQQQQPGGYPPPYPPPYPASYGGFDAAPSTQMFSDDDPNAACSLM